MKHTLLKIYIYKFAINMIAERINVSPEDLHKKVEGKIDFTATEVILISDFMNIHDPEYIFLH